ncbi:sentrin-specific protease 1-like, partial [Aphis craccivora]
MDLELKEIQYYDNLGGYNFEETIMCSKLATSNCKKYPSLRKWSRLWTRFAVFNFSQRYMKLFRQLIVYQLTVKRLVDVNVNAKYIDLFIMSLNMDNM